MRKQIISIIGAGLFMFSAGAVNAATTLYTDSVSFEEALEDFSVYGFDNFVLNEGPDSFGSYHSLDQQIPGINFDNARVNLGSYGGTSNSAPNVVLNADTVNPIVIKFSHPKYGVGLFNTSLADAERFEVFDQNGGLIGSVNLPHQIINFGGFISDEGISMAVITPIAPTNGSIYIDDLTVSTVLFPIANAGPDQIICNELCNEVILDGRKSFDENGVIVSYEWTLMHRTDPAFNMAASGETPTISGLEPGVYDVTLMVANSASLNDTDVMVLTVQASCNPCLILKGDFDSDGDVDGDDLKIFVQNFGTFPVTP